MTAYATEVIRDLIAGRLPWPQTRRIMSAYKDDDRFFKYVAVLQERVGWKDPILLPAQRPSLHRPAGQTADHLV